MAEVKIPEGFVRDTPDTAIPEGFVKDRPNMLEQFVGGTAQGLGGDIVNAAAGRDIVGSGEPYYESAPGMAGYYLGTGLTWATGTKLIGAAYSAANATRSLAAQRSTISRLFKQMSDVNLADDAVGSVLMGTAGYYGAEAAEERLGAPFRGVGEAVGGVAAVVPAQIGMNFIKRMRNVADDLLKQGVPDNEALKGAANTLYTSLDEAGVVVANSGDFSSKLANFANERKLDFRQDVRTVVGATIRDLIDAADKGKLTYGLIHSQVSNLRQTAADDTAGGVQKLLAKELEESMLKMARAQGDEAVEATVLTANSAWQRHKTSEAINDAIDIAEIESMPGHGRPKRFDVELSNQLRKMLRPDAGGQGKFLSDQQKSLIKDIIQGTDVEKRLRALDIFGVSSDDFVRTMLVTSLVGGAVAGASGPAVGLGAGAATLLAGTGIAKLASMKASAMFKENAKLGSMMIRAGGDARDIIRGYMKNVPKAERRPEDLASLFINNRADVTGLSSSKFVRDSKFLTGSVLVASIMSQMEEKDRAVEMEQARANYSTANDVPTVPTR